MIAQRLGAHVSRGLDRPSPPTTALPCAADPTTSSPRSLGS
jgi:hypothetical protein